MKKLNSYYFSIIFLWFRHKLSNEPETFKRDGSMIRHLVSFPSFARQSPLANDGDDTRWPMIVSSLLKVSTTNSFSRLVSAFGNPADSSFCIRRNNLTLNRIKLSIIFSQYQIKVLKNVEDLSVYCSDKSRPVIGTENKNL